MHGVACVIALSMSHFAARMNRKEVLDRSREQGPSEYRHSIEKMLMTCGVTPNRCRRMGMRCPCLLNKWRKHFIVTIFIDATGKLQKMLKSQ
jgi:hypothetical protein